MSRTLVERYQTIAIEITGVKQNCNQMEDYCKTIKINTLNLGDNLQMKIRMYHKKSKL